jgi:hypothetical protein
VSVCGPGLPLRIPEALNALHRRPRQARGRSPALPGFHGSSSRDVNRIFATERSHDQRTGFDVACATGSAPSRWNRPEPGVVKSSDGGAGARSCASR